MIAWIHEQVGYDRQPVSQGIGHNRHAEMLALQARVFLQHLVAPQLAQLRLAGRRRVGEDILGIESGELFVDAGQIHGTVLLGGDPDGGVELVRLFLGFGRLSQNSLGEKQVFPKIGQ